MKINFKRKVLDVPDVGHCRGIRIIKGLMFSNKEKANALIFEFEENTIMKIHSCFVFFPFIAIWLNEKDEVINFKFVRPFTLNVSLEQPYRKLLEIPINSKYQSVIESFSTEMRKI